MTLCNVWCFVTEAVADLPEHEAIKLKEKLEELNNMDAEVTMDTRLGWGEGLTEWGYWRYVCGV